MSDDAPPREREPNWFVRSSGAAAWWRGAVANYWERIGAYPWTPDPSADPGRPERAMADLDAQLASDRAWYRNLVLGWFAALCLPLVPGEAVLPGEVERLLAEEEAAPPELRRTNPLAVAAIRSNTPLASVMP